MLVLTKETPAEFAERMITSYSKAAYSWSRQTDEYAPFIAGWYARECMRLDRRRFEQGCNAMINDALLAAGCVRVA